MSRHRADPPPRVRPRYARLGAAATASTVTAIALLGGIGVIPVDKHHAAAAVTGEIGTAVVQSAHAIATETPVPPSGSRSASPSARPSQSASPQSSSQSSSSLATSTGTALPADAGEGKRIVFAMTRQRVWLVDSEGTVERSYLVSGSLTDNLHPGSYRVYSKSRWAVGVDDSGTMQYFVRFTRGQNAAIGFHSVPTKDGRLEQTRSELGSPQSHGCIRQWLPDAIRLWDFAPVGTKVVVTA